MNGNLVRIRSQRQAKAFQPLADEQYFIDSWGLYVQLSKWYKYYYDISYTNTEGNLQGFGTCSEQVRWRALWIYAGFLKALLCTKGVWTSINKRNTLKLFVEWLLLVSACSESALLPKALFKLCHPLQWKWIIWSELNSAYDCLQIYDVSCTTSWNKKLHMYRHVPWTWSIPTKIIVWVSLGVSYVKRMYACNSQEKSEQGKTENEAEGKEIKRCLWKWDSKDLNKILVQCSSRKTLYVVWNHFIYTYIYILALNCGFPNS